MVKVATNRYMRSHGKPPRGEGQWWFTSKEYGDVDYNDETEVLRMNQSMPLSKAAAAAKSWGRANGHMAVYVMESTKTPKVNEGNEMETFEVSYTTKAGKRGKVKVKARDKKEAEAKVRGKANYNGDASASLVKENTMNPAEMPGSKSEFVVRLLEPHTGDRTAWSVSAPNEDVAVKYALRHTRLKNPKVVEVENLRNVQENTSYEKDMDASKKVVVKGVKGMKSTPFTKTFKNQAAYEKWADSDAAGDYEVSQVMNEAAEFSTWKVTFKSDHKAQTVKARNTTEAAKKAAAKAKGTGTGDPIHKDVKKVTNESKLTEGVLDSMDDDGFMAKRQLYDLAKYSVELHGMIQDTDDLEPWIQAKITTAADYIDTVKHYLEYGQARDADDTADVMGPPDMADIDDVDAALGNMGQTEEVMEFGDEDEGSAIYPEDVLRWASNRGVISDQAYDAAIDGQNELLWNAAQDTADWIGSVTEVGSSDVSIWLKDFVNAAQGYGAVLDGGRAHLYEAEVKAKNIYNKMMKKLRIK